MLVPDARPLRELEAENTKLKNLPLEARLGIRRTEYGLRGKALAPLGKAWPPPS